MDVIFTFFLVSVLVGVLLLRRWQQGSVTQPPESKPDTPEQELSGSGTEDASALLNAIPPEKTLFPNLVPYLPAPQWYCVAPEMLSGQDMARAYRRAIADFVPESGRMWALSQSGLFVLLDKYGGWQAYLLGQFDVPFGVATGTVMDVILSSAEDPQTQAYWLALTRESESVPLPQQGVSEELAEQHPVLWAKHVEGLRWLDVFFQKGFSAEPDNVDTKQPRTNKAAPSMVEV